MRETPFLDLAGLAAGNEQGLLGLAFDPLYVDNGLLYVNVTVADGTTEIRRYRTSRTDPDLADASSEVVLLSYAQPFSNHNGGWLAFGPDGCLYISTGDGGSAFDPGNRAQSLNTLLGKLLRIDVRGTNGSTGRYGIPPDNPFVHLPNARPEIWAYGLRNPWRCSFDRATGDLYIGDVGQNQIEEVDFQPASNAGGENYGWRVMEGTRCSDDSRAGGNPPCGDPSLVPPIHEYTHAVGVSVTGGYVYRGRKLGGWQGTYFFADYGSARIWSFRYRDGVLSEFTEQTAELNPGLTNISFLSSFGEGPDGELYVLDLGDGEVFPWISDGRADPRRHQQRLPRRFHRPEHSGRELADRHAIELTPASCRVAVSNGAWGAAGVVRPPTPDSRRSGRRARAVAAAASALWLRSPCRSCAATPPDPVRRRTDRRFVRSVPSRSNSTTSGPRDH